MKGAEEVTSSESKRQSREFVPRLIAWEITRSCVLSCAHCRASSERGPYEGELTTDECMRVLDEIARVSRPILILTGGEALLRDDVYAIAARATELGMRPVLASCGTVINQENAERMVEAGIQRVSISLDVATGESHDSFRGEKGAFEGALRGIEFLKKAGMEFQINTTVTRRNVGELRDILELAVSLGACAFHPFLLVPTGRGKELAEEELSPSQYEEVLTWIHEESRRIPLDFKPTCAPHYHRIVRQRGDRPERAGGFHSLTRGCMGGCSFCFISHVGDVQMCGFLDKSAGSLREESFERIWRQSPFFLSLRDFESYHGKCGYCEFRKVCGGCRARAFAMTGDYLAEEPFCDYVPDRNDGNTRDDRDLLSALQDDFPPVEAPYAAIAERLSLPENEVLRRVEELKKRRVIRRIGAVFDQKALGYRSTLATLSVPPGELEKTASFVSAFSEVTHNYSRRHKFNLWFTITASSQERMGQIVRAIEEYAGHPVHLLPAKRTFKVRAVFEL